jgi:hypothetical protein
MASPSSIIVFYKHFYSGRQGKLAWEGKKRGEELGERLGTGGALHRRIRLWLTAFLPRLCQADAILASAILSAAPERAIALQKMWEERSAVANFSRQFATQNTWSTNLIWNGSEAPLMPLPLITHEFVSTIQGGDGSVLFSKAIESLETMAALPHQKGIG